MGKWNNLFQLTKSGECKVVSCGNHWQEFNAPNLLCQFGMLAFVGHNFGHVFQLKLCMSENVGHTRQRVEPRDIKRSSPVRAVSKSRKNPNFGNILSTGVPTTPTNPQDSTTENPEIIHLGLNSGPVCDIANGDSFSRMYPCLILVSIGISTGDPCIWKVFLCMSNRCFPAKIPVWTWF